MTDRNYSNVVTDNWLLQAFKSCSSDMDAERLLENIEVFTSISNVCESWVYFSTDV